MLRSVNNLPAFDVSPPGFVGGVPTGRRETIFREKSRICPTVSVGIWASSVRKVCGRVVSLGAVSLTSLVVCNLAVMPRYRTSPVTFSTVEGALVNIFLGMRWRLQQLLWKNSLERVAENDKKEGDQFGDCIRSRIQM